MATLFKATYQTFGEIEELEIKKHTNDFVVCEQPNPVLPGEMYFGREIKEGSNHKWCTSREEAVGYLLEKASGDVAEKKAAWIRAEETLFELQKRLQTKEEVRDVKDSLYR